MDFKKNEFKKCLKEALDENYIRPIGSSDSSISQWENWSYVFLSHVQTHHLVSGRKAINSASVMFTKTASRDM